jgi:hypothetical protein
MISVQSQFVNNFNFPLNVSTFGFQYWGPQLLTVSGANYSVPSGGRINLNGNITALDGTVGDWVYLSLVAVAFNPALNITIYFEQSFYIQINPNAILSANIISGVIGTNFTNQGKPKSSPVVQMNLPNNSYWDKTFGIAQVYGINEDLLKLLGQAQESKRYSGDSWFFQDSAAFTYISALIYSYVSQIPNPPYDILYNLQWALQSSIMYDLPNY